LTDEHGTNLKKHSWDTQNKNNNPVLIGITELFFVKTEKVRKSGQLQLQQAVITPSILRN